MIPGGIGEIGEHNGQPADDVSVGRKKIPAAISAGISKLPKRGLEPPRGVNTPLGPEPSASASSATWACGKTCYRPLPRGASIGVSGEFARNATSVPDSETNYRLLQTDALKTVRESASTPPAVLPHAPIATVPRPIYAAHIADSIS